MEQNVIFKSEFIKNITERDSINLEEFKNSYLTIIIDSEILKLTEEEYQYMIEDLNNLCDNISENSVSRLEIKDINLIEKSELYDIVCKILKNCDYIRIENLICESVENLLQQIFNKELEINENLQTQNNIKKFEYNVITKNLTIDSKNLPYLDDYKQYVSCKNLIVEISQKEGKKDIVENIEKLRQHTDGTIFLKDVSPDKNVTELLKYENYANRRTVLFKSNIIKKSMGFDRLPTDGSGGITYNLRINGQALIENDMYLLEENELITFLNDIEEVSRYCPLNGITINYIKIQSEIDLNIFSKVFSRVKRINIENSCIPNLKDIINEIEDKDKIEVMNIKECGLSLEDIDVVRFLNMKRLSVEKEKFKIEDKSRNAKIIEKIQEIESIEVKLPWYKRMWKKIRVIFVGSEYKALPGDVEK